MQYTSRGTCKFCQDFPATATYCHLQNLFESATFAWVGVEHSEVIFLNDFRWGPQIIPWYDLLLMLEGQPVHLPAPKSHFCKGILFDRETPIFGTSKHELVFVRGGVVDERETEMMQFPWPIFHLSRQIRQQDQRAVPPCGKCFAHLVLSEIGRASSEEQQE